MDQIQQLAFFKKNKLAVKVKHLVVLAATVFSYFGTTHFMGLLDNNSKKIVKVTDLGIDCESVVTDYSMALLTKGNNLSKIRRHEWDIDHNTHMSHEEEIIKHVDASKVEQTKKAYRTMDLARKKLAVLLTVNTEDLKDRADLDSLILWESKYLKGVNSLVGIHQSEREEIMAQFKIFVIVLALSFLVLIYFSYVIIVHPIQSRFKKSLEDLIDQKTRLRTLVDGTEELIWSVDRNGHLLMFNKAFETFFENKYNETPWLDMDTNRIEFFKSQQPAYEKALKGHTFTICSNKNKTDHRVYESRFDPVKRKGQVIGCIVRRTDVTERERAVNEIKKRKEDLMEAQEIANMGSWNWSIESDLIDWSDHLYTVFGQDKGSFVPCHKTVKQLIHPFDRRVFEYSIKHILKRKRKTNFDMVYRILVGEGTRFVHQKGRLFRDSHGQPIRMAGTIQDVTEKVLSDQKIERQNKELHHFVNVVSHNLRRPLSNLLALTHLYESGHCKENDFLLDHIRISGEDLDSTIKDLSLSLSLKEVDTANFTEVKLDAIIDDTIVLLQREIQDTRAELTLETNCTGMKGIKGYYVNILYHLLSNAITYCKPGIPPKIKVSVVENSNDITIKVRDNGIGMKLTAQNKRKIFDLYGRLSGKTSGKGLGLYLVKNQLEAMHGEIDVHSRPHKGSVFEIKIAKYSDVPYTENDLFKRSSAERSKVVPKELQEDGTPNRKVLANTMITNGMKNGTPFPNVDPKE